MKFKNMLYKIMALVFCAALGLSLFNDVSVNAAKVKKPGKATITEVKSSDSKIIVKFKKVSKAKGYQIQWADNESFSKAQSALLKKNNKSVMTYKTVQIDPGKYFVRVRALK